MSRIAARFATLGKEARGALIPFLTAFDPDRGTSLALLRGMPAAGADLIEIGMPFSDPSADGPSVQAASKRGLAGGATVAGTLALVSEFRAADDRTPVVLMGYLNPLLRFGIERFCAEAARVGVDGLIVVDLPPEEADLLLPSATAEGIDLIRLVAPTTGEARLGRVLEGSSGFVYYVSIAGVTGTRSASEAELAGALPRIRRATTLPVAIGFGIRTPNQAAAATRVADGAVVASALLDTLAASLDADGGATAATVPAILEQLRALAVAVRGARAPASATQEVPA